MLHEPGPARCFGLLYSGEHAIDLIRAKLGNTNPEEAEVGSASRPRKDPLRAESGRRALAEDPRCGSAGTEPERLRADTHAPDE